MILVIDNMDSFVFNLARYAQELGYEVEVIRNNVICVQEVLAKAPSHVIFSPGPCTPNEAGICLELTKVLDLPLLGVCLGHQVIGQAFGADVVKANYPMHGKASPILHDGQGLFKGLPEAFLAARYHSLVLDPATLPASIKVRAWSKEGEIMAIEHTTLPFYGVQFHPESVLTETGKRIVEAFLSK